MNRIDSVIQQQTDSSLQRADQEWLNNAGQAMTSQMKQMVTILRAEFRKELQQAFREEYSLLRKRYQGTSSRTGGLSGMGGGALGAVLQGGFQIAEDGKPSQSVVNSIASAIMAEIAPDAWKQRNQSMSGKGGLSHKQWLGELAKMLAKTQRNR